MSVAERWQRVQQLCEALERMAPAERLEWLERNEPGADIRREALALLAAMEEEAQTRLAPGGTLRPTAPILPERIGPYRITGILGQGGSGVVFTAEMERSGERQLVAVKLLHISLSDAESERRFRREQRILARLDHPGITRWLDAGVTADGRPYLVMERVEGQPIDEYCRARRMDVAGRLRLLVQVAHAVHAAHRQLIVHLDLKPSNVLVTSDGQVKLLDFGTAKLLDPLGDLTTTWQLTPLYASPEQLRGEPVSTACDVFALGVILYELLAGVSPFGTRASLVAVAERASGRIPLRSMTSALTGQGAAERGTSLEKLRSALRGDLQSIAGKALAAEPDQRYVSALSLAEDLDRHMENRPVLAQRQTLSYRARKYVQRHAGALAVAGLVALGLITAGGYAWRQQQKALYATRHASATAHFLHGLIQGSSPYYTGRQQLAMLEAVELALPRLERIQATQPELAVGLMTNAGLFLQANGKVSQGTELLRRAWALARQSPDDMIRLIPIATLAATEANTGRCAEAIALVREGDVIFQRRERSMHDADRASYLADRAGVAAGCENDRQAQLQLLERAAAAVAGLADDSVESELPPRVLKALVWMNYGLALVAHGRYSEAGEQLEKGLRTARAEPGAKAVEISLHRSWSTLEAEEGHAADAERAMRDAVTLSEGVLPPREYYRLRSLWALRTAEAGDHLRAMQRARDAVAGAQMVGADGSSLDWVILLNSAMTAAICGECEDSLRWLAHADRLSGGKLPAAWQANRLGAEGLCRLRGGRDQEGAELLAEARRLMPKAPASRSVWRAMLVKASGR